MEFKEQAPIKELERVFTVVTRPGEEQRFTVVEKEGELRGDIRYFSESRKREGMLARKRGIHVLPNKYKDFTEGVALLGKALEKHAKLREKEAR